MGNCASSSTGMENARVSKPASVIGSVGNIGSVCDSTVVCIFFNFQGNEDNVTVTSFGNESASMQNNANSIATNHNVSAAGESTANDGLQSDRRGSFTPSIARSEEADGAVVAGYAEPSLFRILRRDNDQSSLEALEKAVKDDPNIRSANLKVDNAPSRRPTALGVNNMQ